MVSTGNRDQLELPLSLAEFSEALRLMPTNKSPGMDTLTVEFYRVFWDVLGPDLASVWAKSLKSGVLPLSCRQAVLALLLKKGDLRDLRNWCPISLLSTDYKIVAKAIPLRLKSVLADVVHPDETYTIPGRTIFNNLFLIRDLLGSTGSHFSMLGIGDIVMPGLLLCFVLRYDNYKKQANSDSCGTPGPGNISGRMQKVSYFHCTLIGYFVGLLTATVASRIHRAAQPALLYLVPFTLLPLLTMAYLKGDLRRMWSEPFHSKSSSSRFLEV
nr:signal peptide peptidase-like 3 [Pelodiscus sinensis]|eukprot:XP_006133796.3 signal peptide peptidase-like 3 [Pelodiscus sinensis]